MATPDDFPATCPGCQATYRVPASMAGFLVTCETCKTDFLLPDASTKVPPPADLPERSTTKPSRTKGAAMAKNGLLLLAGAGVVWGISALLKPAPETPIRPSAPAVPEPVISTTVTKRRPAAAPAGPGPTQPETPQVPVLPSVPPPPPLADTATRVPLPPPTIATQGPAPAPAPAVVPPPPAATPLENALQNSRRALERFLLAKTVADRLAVSQNPDKIRPLMEGHYRDHPIGPLPLDQITFLTEGAVPDSTRKFHLYNVSLRDQEAAIPMAVEETADGYRVDWPTFVECYTHALRTFFATPSETPGLFRVMLRRAHYFGPAVPGQDTVRISYTVEPPTREESFHVWVDKDSLVYKDKLARGERSGWDAESYVIVELMWRGDDAKGRWVSLRRITTDSWRSE